jgi:hypothetical protein
MIYILESKHLLIWHREAKKGDDMKIILDNPHT